MNDLISRKELLDKPSDYCNNNCDFSEKQQRHIMCSVCGIGVCKDNVENAGAYESEWVEDEEQKHVEKCYHCLKCGFNAWGSYEKTRFCGGCGARMKGCD